MGMDGHWARAAHDLVLPLAEGVVLDDEEQEWEQEQEETEIRRQSAR
jgi:hypothetical protein